MVSIAVSALSLAKTSLPPRRTTLLHRPRLVDELYKHRAKQLFLISAPAGYGKTSLALDFAHRADFPVAWYALDEFDNKPHTFLAYLIASIRTHYPDFGASALAALERATDTLDAFQPVATLIANELFQLPDELAIVLDDYHVIHNEVIHQLVAQLIHHTGARGHFVVNSRTLPRIPDQILLLARGQLVGLGLNDLRFTAAEIQALAQQNYGLQVSLERAQELAQVTDGWITALLLMGHQSGWQQLIEGALTIPEVAGHVYAYLAEQVFTRQPEALRHFLLGSSVLEPLAPELLDTLPRLSESRKHLAALQAQQLFTTRLAGRGELYTYHPLFREFLLARLQRDDPTWHEQLLLASAQLYAKQGQWERVVEIYLSLKRMDDAACALEAAEEAARSIPQVARLMSYLETLPFRLVETRPHLLSLRAKHLFFNGKLEPAVAAFDRAVQMFLEARAPVAAADKLLWKAMALQGLGQYQMVIDESARIEELLAVRQDLIHPRAINWMNKGQAELSQGSLSQALHSLRQAQEFANTTEDLRLQADSALGLGMVLRASGYLNEALEHYHAALRLWEQLQNPSSAVNTLNSLGYAYLLKGETETAEKVLLDALARVRDTKMLRSEALILATLGDLHKDADNLRKALELFNEGLRVAQLAQYAYAVTYGRLALSDTYRLMGELELAERWLTAAQETIQAKRSTSELMQLKLAQGLLAADRAQYTAALALIAEAEDFFRQTGDKHLEATAAFHQARWLQQLGRWDEAIFHLQRIVELTAQLGYDHFLVVLGRRAEPLLRQASALPAIGNTFEQILERARAAHSPTSLIVSQPESGLEVYTLGQERFVLNGTQVTKLRTQTRDLFLFLLSRHPHGARPDELCELLWPDLPSERALDTLHTSVTRIRRTLCPVALSNGWYMLAPERLWYDAREFEQRLGKAQNAQEPSERIRCLQQALELYGGDYLMRVQGAWVLSEQERLRKAYLNGLLTLAQTQRETKSLEAALQMYAKASQAEPFLEAAWLGGMEIYWQLGNRAAALAHYEKLKNILNTELRIKPSPEAQALYRKILNAR
jgi:ATP/maltotriose-dependent transcriptional regulator MalT/two-component SAPR family response regulator